MATRVTKSVNWICCSDEIPPLTPSTLQSDYDLADPVDCSQDIRRQALVENRDLKVPTSQRLIEYLASHSLLMLGSENCPNARFSVAISSDCQIFRALFAK